MALRRRKRNIVKTVGPKAIAIAEVIEVVLVLVLIPTSQKLTRKRNSVMMKVKKFRLLRNEER